MKPYYLCLLLLLTACHCPRPCPPPPAAPTTLRGVYQLDALQAQNETVFKPMKDVEIIKIFTGSNWISAAYLMSNKKVVNLQGGTYTLSGHQMHETIQYHSKDLQSVGVSTTYNVFLNGDRLYQSGVFKRGTPDEWKVEEYWKKVGE